MRISCWSSDVCSSDLAGRVVDIVPGHPRAAAPYDVVIGGKLETVLEIHVERVELEPAIILEGLATRMIIIELKLQCRSAAPASVPARDDIAASKDLVRQGALRSEEHPSELQSLMRTSYA